MPKLALEWQNSSLLTAVFNQLSDALILYDRHMRISGVNEAAERLFGITSDEMVGKDCRDVFRCGVCEPGCGVLIGMKQAPSVARATVRLHTDNGRERMAVMSTTQLFNDDGELEGMASTIRDITEEIAPQKREVIAESRLMRDLLNFTKRVAASEATTILLEGENGTGKDLI